MCTALLPENDVWGIGEANQGERAASYIGFLGMHIVIFSEENAFGRRLVRHFASARTTTSEGQGLSASSTFHRDDAKTRQFNSPGSTLFHPFCSVFVI
jgi:hypothetical protein